jgi:hypothetical protein
MGARPLLAHGQKAPASVRSWAQRGPERAREGGELARRRRARRAEAKALKNVVIVGLLLIACPVGADLVYPLMVPVNCSVLLYPPNNVGAANPSLRWSLQGDTCIIIRVRDLG